MFTSQVLVPEIMLPLFTTGMVFNHQYCVFLDINVLVLLLQSRSSRSMQLFTLCSKVSYKNHVAYFVHDLITLKHGELEVIHRITKTGFELFF